MNDTVPLHFIGPSHNLQPKNKDELNENKLITAFMQYKATTIRDDGKRNPYVPFLQRNLIYVQMDELADREKIEQFINKHSDYPSFWIRPKKKSTVKKRPLHEMIEFLQNREAFNVDMQRMIGLFRNFSIAEMADYSWKIKKNLGIYLADYQPANDHVLALDHKPVRKSAAKKRKIMQPTNTFKKNTLFPTEIQYRLCFVSGQDTTRKPILNGISCTKTDDKVLCCIFCEKKFETLFHLLFHCNMCYPKLQFIPVFKESGKSKYAIVDIVNNRKYQDIDEVTLRKYVGSMTVFFVFPGDRRRNNKIIPMNPTLPFENFSTFNFVFEDDVYKSVLLHPANRRFIKGFSLSTVDNLPNVDLLIEMKKLELFDFVDITYVCKVFMFTWDAMRIRLGDHRFRTLGLFRFTKMYIHIHRKLIEKYGKQMEDIIEDRIFQITPVPEGYDAMQLMWLQKDLIRRLYEPNYGSITHSESVPISVLKCEVFRQRTLYKRKCKNYPKAYCDQQFNRLAQLTNEQVEQIIVEKRWPEILPVAMKLGLFPKNHYIHMLLEEPMDGFKTFNILAPTNIMKIPEYPEEEHDYLIRFDSPREVAGWYAKNVEPNTSIEVLP